MSCLKNLQLLPWLSHKMPLAEQRSKSLQHPNGADGAAKPPGALLKQAGLRASPREISHRIPQSHLWFGGWQAFCALIMQCMRLHNSDLLLSCIRSPPHRDRVMRRTLNFPPERQMASEAPANGSAHVNEINHLFLSNVNQAERYESFIQGSWFPFFGVVVGFFFGYAFPPKSWAEFKKVSKLVLPFPDTSAGYSQFRSLWRKTNRDAMRERLERILKLSETFNIFMWMNVSRHFTAFFNQLYV